MPKLALSGDLISNLNVDSDIALKATKTDLGHNEPKPNQPKTWTRISRMEVGPPNTIMTTPKLKMGKRVVGDALGEERDKRTETSLQKQSKVRFEDGNNTLVRSNENTKLELPRAWRPLDSSYSSQNCEGTSSLNIFSYRN